MMFSKEPNLPPAEEVQPLAEAHSQPSSSSQGGSAAHGQTAEVPLAVECELATDSGKCLPSLLPGLYRGMTPSSLPVRVRSH